VRWLRHRYRDLHDPVIQSLPDAYRSALLARLDHLLGESKVSA
jgi:hypothetical protein